MGFLCKKWDTRFVLSASTPSCAPTAAAANAIAAERPGSCSNHGVVTNGVCACTDPWVGATCQYSVATTCSGRGDVDALSGSCACASLPHVDMLSGNCACAVSDRGKILAARFADSGVLPGNYTGHNCSEEPLLVRAEADTASMSMYVYVAWGVIMAIVGAVGIWWYNGAPHWECCMHEAHMPNRILAPFTILWMGHVLSTWAFYGIALRKGGLFYHVYTAQGGDYSAVDLCSVISCIWGTITFVNGCLLVSISAGENGPNNVLDLLQWFAPLVAVEHAVQIVLQIIYFDALGFENAEGIAIFAWVCSCTSVGGNSLIFTMSAECCTSCRCTVRKKNPVRVRPWHV